MGISAEVPLRGAEVAMSWSPGKVLAGHGEKDVAGFVEREVAFEPSSIADFKAAAIFLRHIPLRWSAVLGKRKRLVIC